jgi:hypothetical protein
MKIALLVLGAIVIAGAAAAGGYYYGKDVGQKAAVTSYQSFLQERMGGQVAGGQASGQLPAGAIPFGGQAQVGQQGQANAAVRGGTTGQVSKVEDGKITLSTQDGPVVVLVENDITLRKTSEITVKELAVGETLIVIGDRDPQGNLIARSIQIGGAQFIGGMAGGAQPNGTPQSGNIQQRRPTQTAP